MLLERGADLRIDLEDFRRHYAMLSDEALFALNRNDLVSAAQQVYDEEMARRKASLADADLAEMDEDFAPSEEEPDADLEAPDWLDEASCACAFNIAPSARNTYSPELVKARAALLAARIPCHVEINEVEEPAKPAQRVRHEHCLMVPGFLNLHATSILDRDLFNADQEAEWRAHLAILSDEELRQLDPKVFCAGLLDRAARLKRAFEDEAAQRKLAL